ncbi:Hydrogenase/urease nickel incorporation protein HypA [Aquicella siphonis]|uniref:Hydrogenase maturation factor HypA n=1 Tax=Aquicella siphonis TaxID=254247 RepID=A0A5E4PEW3_9COXI|nr:hydrogenase maturation nickel metallochaperone HypA [Aquicella siphonis]VVC75529.1 Hydrogenase/urease nickel incorporation protein HypA [Aquicella siphonis]
MHELWLSKNIIEIVLQSAAGRRQKRVKKISLEIGALAAVEPSALAFSFTVAARNTIANGAILEIISVPGKARCESCGKTVNISQYSDACDDCGGYALTVIQGEELRVKSMEAE